MHRMTKYFFGIKSEIDKLRKFRSFLRNLNIDYPLVDYQAHNADGNNAPLEYEECAICKEHMV